jgi:hypothetical protein
MGKGLEVQGSRFRVGKRQFSVRMDSNLEFNAIDRIISGMIVASAWKQLAK